MPSTTRRRLLQACVGVVAVSAGCGESGSDEPPTTTREEHRRPVDAETKRLRYDGEPIVYSTDGDEEPDETVGPLLVATDDKRESLEYRTHPDGWRDLKAFVDGIDLSKATLLLVQTQIGECYQRRLQSARMDDGLDVDFCRQLLPATVACDREKQVMEALAVRLPFAIENIRGYSVGVGGRCRFERTEGER